MIRYTVLRASGRIPLARFTSLDALAVFLRTAPRDVTIVAQNTDVIRDATPYRQLTATERQRLDELV